MIGHRIGAPKDFRAHSINFVFVPIVNEDDVIVHLRALRSVDEIYEPKRAQNVAGIMQDVFVGCDYASWLAFDERVIFMMIEKNDQVVRADVEPRVREAAQKILSRVSGFLRESDNVVVSKRLQKLYGRVRPMEFCAGGVSVHMIARPAPSGEIFCFRAIGEVEDRSPQWVRIFRSISEALVGQDYSVLDTLHSPVEASRLSYHLQREYKLIEKEAEPLYRDLRDRLSALENVVTPAPAPVVDHAIAASKDSGVVRASEIAGLAETARIYEPDQFAKLGDKPAEIIDALGMYAFKFCPDCGEKLQ